VQSGAFWQEIDGSSVSILVNENIAIMLDSCIDIVACYFNFYRAMHFSAKRGIAIACLSVCPSVRTSVCRSVTLVDCDHIGWNSSKLISPLVSTGCSLFATPT